MGIPAHGTTPPSTTPELPAAPIDTWKHANATVPEALDVGAQYLAPHFRLPTHGMSPEMLPMIQSCWIAWSQTLRAPPKARPSPSAGVPDSAHQLPDRQSGLGLSGSTTAYIDNLLALFTVGEPSFDEGTVPCSSARGPDSETRGSAEAMKGTATQPGHKLTPPAPPTPPQTADRPPSPTAASGPCAAGAHEQFRPGSR